MLAGGAVAVERLHQRRRSGVRWNGWMVRSFGGLRMGSHHQRARHECRSGKGSNSCSHFGVLISAGRGGRDVTPVPSVTEDAVPAVLHEVIRSSLDLRAKAPETGGLFQEIGGAGNARGGFGHLGGDFAGSSDILRSEDDAQIRDQ
jgi:hypothetical protein